MRENGLGSISGGQPSVSNEVGVAKIRSVGERGRSVSKVGPLRKFLDRYFYLGMSLLIALVVVFGFSQTIGANLLHPDSPPPWILPIHAVVFSGWVLLFIAQSALVRASKPAWHRRLGMFGAVVGAVLPVLGVTTALIMRHWHDQQGGANDAGLSLPFNDMLVFSITFGLAIVWRRRPEFHRRLMLLAMCCLTGAAFARFPEGMLPGNTFYVCVDLLVLLGVVRDLIINGRVHAVYRYGLPCMMVGQAFAQYLIWAKPSWWLAVTHQIMQ